MNAFKLETTVEGASSCAAHGSEPVVVGASRRRVGFTAGSWPAVAWKKIFRASILFS